MDESLKSVEYETLIEKLLDTDPNVRKDAAEALGSSGS